MNPAGQIDIRLDFQLGRVSAVTINSSRPKNLCQHFIGKNPEQVLTTLPLLFSLCSNAQAYAALQAFQQALGQAAEPEADAARQLLVKLETLREHVWRILLDWPKLAGLNSDKTSLGQLLSLDKQVKNLLFQQGKAFSLDSVLAINTEELNPLINKLIDLVDNSVFNGQLSTFQALHNQQQLRLWQTKNPCLAADFLTPLSQQNRLAIGNNPIPCLPDLSNQDWLTQLHSVDLNHYSQQPHWQGQHYETTPLNRQQHQPLIIELQQRYGNGIYPRFLACLTEVAELAIGLPSGCFTSNIRQNTTNSANGTGLAQIHAARGLLIHFLSLKNGLVADYHIIAPTEWNFQPGGVVEQGLLKLKAKNDMELKQLAELWVYAVDPCVAVKIDIENVR